MNGNFYNTPRPLCFKWQRVIPAVYDDALTYDALMMKIIYTVNKIIENQYLSVPYLISTSFQATNDSIHVTGSLMQDYEAINLDVELVTSGMDDGQYYINVYNESKAKYVGKDVDQQPPLYISTQFMPMNCTTLYKFQILDGKIVQDSIEYNDLYTHMHNIDPEAHKGLFDGVNARITQEINDRIAADTQLQSNIDAETEARKEADNALESSITTERSERIAADTALQNNINAETTARENADTTLQNNINAEATARKNADTTLQNNIDTEIQDRENADTQLQTSINNEVQARKDAITAEENARNQADTALGNRIDTEISDRQAAVTGVQNNLTNHINNKANPHGVTKAQVGLENVTNTVGVTKLNNIDGSVNLVAGSNVTISNDPTGKNITIGSTGGGGGGSDVTVNGLDGAINIVGSGRASVSTAGQNITVNNEPYEGGTGISIVGNDINNTGVLTLNNVNGKVTIGQGVGIKTAVSGQTLTITNDGVQTIFADGRIFKGNVAFGEGYGISITQDSSNNIINISNTGPIRRNAVFSMKDASGTPTGFSGKAILEFPFSELPYLKGWLYTGTINIPSTIGNNFTLDFAGSNFYFDYAADPTYPLGTPRFFVIDTDCKIIGFFTHSGNNTNKLVFTLKTPGVIGSLLPTCIPIVSSAG